MELLSGILLTGVSLGIIGYLLYAFIGERAQQLLQHYAQGSSETGEDPLVGAVGRVVEYQQGAELMKVRIRGERWSANLVDGRGLAVGTEVKVTAVKGLTLDVEACVDEHADTAGAAVEET